MQRRHFLTTVAAGKIRSRRCGAPWTDGRLGMPPSLPEVWLRGPVAGFPPELMPVAHSLLQVLEEVEAVIRPLSFEELWTRPGGAASIGFHLKHLGGSLDRLLTYARGESLSDVQRSALDGEERAGLANDQPAILLRAACAPIDGPWNRSLRPAWRRWTSRDASGGRACRRLSGDCCFMPPSTPSATRGRSSPPPKSLRAPRRP